MNNKHSHYNNTDDTDVKNIRLAFFLNVGFTIFEIIGGVLTNSVAILSDAVHDFGDSLSLGLAWYFQKLSKKGRNKRFSYGYRRFSILGAIITSFAVLFSSIFILTHAVNRFQSQPEVNPKGMILIAIVGIIANGIAVIRLKKGSSLNEKVVMLHFMEDVLGWIAVLVGSIIIYFFDLPIIDPILSICIVVFILKGVYKNLKSTFTVILQTIPNSISRTSVIEYLETVNNIAEVRDLHIWSMDDQYNILSVHLILLNEVPLKEIEDMKCDIRKKLLEFGIEHPTIETEFS